MGKEYLIDTNTVVFYFDNKLPHRVNAIIENGAINISVITRMELMSWSGATKPQVDVIKEFIKKAVVHNLEEAVILKAIEIRKKKRMKLPDAIIAATAITRDIILVTNDGTNSKVTEATCRK